MFVDLIVQWKARVIFFRGVVSDECLVGGGVITLLKPVVTSCSILDRFRIILRGVVVFDAVGQGCPNLFFDHPTGH